MSAWFVFNAMGFYPVNPASATYLIGTPLFDKMEIRFPQSDSILEIIGMDAAINPYVAALSITLDDDSEVTFESPILSHADLLRAKQLNFKLSSDPQELFKGSI